MVKKAIAISFIFLCSCVLQNKMRDTMVNLPHSASSWQISNTKKAPSPRRVSKAIEIFYQEWVETFGDKDEKLRHSLDQIMVKWSSKRRLAKGRIRDIKGNIVSHRSIIGITVSPTYIWVYTNIYGRIAATSFVHELVHVALWTVCSNGDPDHEGNKWKCWTEEHTLFIKKINSMLAELDI